MPHPVFKTVSIPPGLARMTMMAPYAWTVSRPAAPSPNIEAIAAAPPADPPPPRPRVTAMAQPQPAPAAVPAPPAPMLVAHEAPAAPLAARTVYAALNHAGAAGKPAIWEHSQAPAAGIQPAAIYARLNAHGRPALDAAGEDVPEPNAGTKLNTDGIYQRINAAGRGLSAQ